jgi:hypothetical protein
MDNAEVESPTDNAGFDLTDYVESRSLMNGTALGADGLSYHYDADGDCYSSAWYNAVEIENIPYISRFILLPKGDEQPPIRLGSDAVADSDGVVHFKMALDGQLEGEFVGTTCEDMTTNLYDFIVRYVDNRRGLLYYKWMQTIYVKYMVLSRSV